MSLLYLHRHNDMLSGMVPDTGHVAIEVWEWTSNIIPRCLIDVITYWD